MVIVKVIAISLLVALGSLYLPKALNFIDAFYCYKKQVPQVLWEERVVIVSQNYATKSPLVSMGRPIFTPKTAPSSTFSIPI